MDDSRFDALTRSLSEVRTRRNLTRLLSALTLGGPLALFGLAESEAKRKKNKKKKKSGRSRRAVPPPGTSCAGGLTSCSGLCKNVQTDPANCGGCGTVCGAGTTCCGGVCSCGPCGTACGVGQTCCNGVCSNLNTDETNCGACDAPCATGQTCCSGLCRNLQTNEAHCGSCGTACTASEVCQAGACFPKSTCPATTTDSCPSTQCGVSADSCICGLSTENNVVCVTITGISCTNPSCASSATCDPGEACIKFDASCCTPATSICVPQCPDPA